MSWLSDYAPLVPGGWLSSAYGGHGVIGANVPISGTHGPSFLRPIVERFGLHGREVRAVIVQKPAGLVVWAADEDGSFDAMGPDGLYWFTVLPYVDGVPMTLDEGYGPGIVRVELRFGPAPFAAPITLAGLRQSVLPRGRRGRRR